jgi:hypothetical protein
MRGNVFFATIFGLMLVFGMAIMGCESCSEDGQCHHRSVDGVVQEDTTKLCNSSSCAAKKASVGSGSSLTGFGGEAISYGSCDCL